MCFISMYSVLNTLSEYTYFCISKSITSALSCLLLKLSEFFNVLLSEVRLMLYFNPLLSRILWILLQANRKYWNMNHQRCSINEAFLKKLFKKLSQHRCFPVNIAKILRARILKNICERLLLEIIHLKN